MTSSSDKPDEPAKPEEDSPPTTCASEPAPPRAPSAQPAPDAAPPHAPSAQPAPDAAPSRASSAQPGPGPPPNRYARGRARDEAIRQNLEPLAPGERPGAVTVAAVVAFVFAAANVVATFTVKGLTTNQGDPSTISYGTMGILMLAGVGMLARQYWAVLLFECVLGLQIAILSLALTRVEKLWLAGAIVVAIGLLGYLFWKLIRPMARLQMPDRPGPAEPTR
jgi:hypothetical protein